MFITKILLLFFILINTITFSSSQKHKVNDLFNGLYDKEIYSGFLNTNIPGRELFYIFTPSQSNPEQDLLYYG